MVFAITLLYVKYNAWNKVGNSISHVPAFPMFLLHNTTGGHLKALILQIL